MDRKLAHIALSLCALIWMAGCAAAEPASSTEGSDPQALSEIMTDLSENAALVNAGLWEEDYAAIAEAAEAIANHPNVSDAERTAIQQVLESDFAAFAEGDKRVHDTALALSEAARAEDMQTVLSTYASLQSECVACHDSFRERLADR